MPAPKTSGPQSDAQKAFEMMKTMVGSWDGSIVGLSTHITIRVTSSGNAILHEATWSIGRAAYLEDLFVRDDERGRGTGRTLIDEVIRCARAAHCATVYWHTQASNDVARRLYDSYGRADDFVRYRLPL